MIHKFIKTEGRRILLEITNLNSQKSVILSHGFMSNKNKPLFVSVSRALSKAGINAIRFNYGTEDINERVNKLREVIKYASKTSNSIGLFGTSLGGMISIIESVNPLIKSLVLVNSVYDQLSAIKNYLKVKPLLLSSFKDKLEKDFFNYNLSLFIKSINKPVFIIAGARDKIIPLSVSRKLYKDVAGTKKLMILRDCGHVVWKEKHLLAVSQAVVNWFLKTL